MHNANQLSMGVNPLFQRFDIVMFFFQSKKGQKLQFRKLGVIFMYEPYKSWDKWY